MTKHAEERCQQRGINKLMLELLFLYGEEVHQRDGAVRTSFTQRGFKQLMKDMRFLNNKQESLRKLFAVEIDGDVVTTGYQTQHIRRK